MFGEKELNELYAVEEVCFSGEVARERFLAETADPMYITVAEKRGGVIVAFALGRVVADEGELYQIGVLPEFRRQGIAERMLRELLSQMEKRGAAQCFLEVRSKNGSAAALYEKCGFEKISVRRGYYPDDDALIYRIQIGT